MTQPTLDASNVLLGLNNGAGVYIGPAGTALPATLSADFASPWTAIGYISDDGVSLSSSTDSDTITPWQSTSPVRTIITGKALELQFVMWETTPLTMGLYFDVTPPTGAAGVLAFDVPSDAGGILYAVALDVKDQTTIFRIAFPRAQLSDTGDVTFSRGDAIGWDATLSALDNNGVLAEVMMTSDAAALSAGGVYSDQSEVETVNGVTKPKTKTPPSGTSSNEAA